MVVNGLSNKGERLNSCKSRQASANYQRRVESARRYLWKALGLKTMRELSQFDDLILSYRGDISELVGNVRMRIDKTTR